jgi:hypothetical protein
VSQYKLDCGSAEPTDHHMQLLSRHSLSLNDAHGVGVALALSVALNDNDLQ